MIGKILSPCLLLILGFSGLVCFGAPRTQVQRPQGESQLEEGMKHLANGHLTEALAAFSRFKQIVPQDARPYFYSGVALTDAGRLTAAALELSEAVRLDPQRLDYLIFQANIFARLKQKTQANDVLASFQSADAERLEASWLQMLAEVYYRLERFDDALQILTLLEKRNPDDPRLDLNRGQVYAVQSQLDQAQESFRKSIAKHPANALAHFELGKLLYQNNEIPAAKSALLEAVRLEKKNPKYLQKLGAVCLALKEIDEAITYLENARALDPDSVETNY